MKYIEDGKRYEGTPSEISEFIGLQEPKIAQTATELQDSFAPLEDIVSESERLRRQLAINPAYNPYGGVVPSKETEEQTPIKKAPTAELDTGVELL